MNRPSPHQGFTLIEVLVSLLIFSSVVSLVVFGLEQGRGQWWHAQQRAQHVKQLSLRQQWLDQLFSQSNGANFQTDYGTANAFFLGTTQQVRLLTDAPVIAGPGTYATVELAIIDHGQGEQALRFRQWPNRDPYYGIPPFQDSSQQLMLLEGISQAQWQYYLPVRTEASSQEIRLGNFRPRQESQWGSEYDAQNEQRIPSQIALTFRYQGQAYRWVFPLSQFSAASDIEGGTFSQ
ncbi:type II secretion system protein [Vibrio metschnikovii]|nr:type II secretion system protein [Vibrio metschnikovii]